MKTTLGKFNTKQFAINFFALDHLFTALKLKFAPALAPALALAFAFCASLSITANAAGLGPIKVTSALGQPFAATVDIVGLQAEEFPLVVARIASAESYEAAKISYLPIVRQIRVAADRVGRTEQQSDGRTILKLSSNAAINEPLIDLLVEFSWGSGRVVQRYSVLLDLPKTAR